MSVWIKRIVVLWTTSRLTIREQLKHLFMGHVLRIIRHILGILRHARLLLRLVHLLQTNCLLDRHVEKVVVCHRSTNFAL
jgi:hypothetical protein